MYPPTLLTNESKSLAVTAAAAVFSTALDTGRVYEYSCDVASYIHIVEPLVVADFVFTATNGTETFTKVAHGLLTGDGPIQVSNAGGALPAGLVAATDYWVIKVDADNFMLATTRANAFAGTNLLITTDGTGVQTASDTADTERPAAVAGGDGSAYIAANTSKYIDGRKGDTLSAVRAVGSGIATLTPVALSKIG